MHPKAAATVGKVKQFGKQRFGRGRTGKSLFTQCAQPGRKVPLVAFAFQQSVREPPIAYCGGTVVRSIPVQIMGFCSPTRGA